MLGTLRKYYKQIIFGVLLIIGLAGCTLKMTYPYADWAMLWYIDDYFDLNASQRHFLEERLKSHHQWHRKQALQDYIQFLKQLQSNSKDQLSIQEVDQIFEDFMRLRQQLVRPFLKDAANFLSTLNTEQLAYFKEQLKEGNEEIQEGLELPKEERLEERFDKTFDYLEDFFDEFSDSQEAQIKALSFALPDTRALWFKNRKHKQQQLLKLLETQPSSEQLEAYLQKSLIDLKQSSLPQYQQAFEQNKQAIKKMVLAIDQMLTPEQRQYALKQMDEWMELLQELRQS